MPSRFSRRAWLIALLMLASVPEASAQSAACGQEPAPRGDYELTPFDGAENVARNAPVWVRYASPAALESALESLHTESESEPCSGRLVCLLHPSAPEHPIAGRLEPVGDDGVVLVPEHDLEAFVDYWVLVARPFLDRATRGEHRISTGESLDREAPELPFSEEDIVVEAGSLPSECGAESGSMRVALEIPAARDDGDPESVSLLVYLSRAAGLRAPLQVARVRNDSDPVRVELVLGEEQASARACVALRAVDGVGRVSSDELELCFDPSRDVAFVGACSIGVACGAPARSSAIAWPTWLASALVFLRCRSSRRARGGRLRDRGSATSSFTDTVTDSGTLARAQRASARQARGPRE